MLGTTLHLVEVVMKALTNIKEYKRDSGTSKIKDGLMTEANLPLELVVTQLITTPFRGGLHDRHRSPSRGGNPGSRQYRNNPNDWHRHNCQPDHRSPFRGNDQVQDDTPFRGRPADRLWQRQRAHESHRCHPREGGSARSRGRWSRRDEASLSGSESSYDSGFSLTDDDGPLSRRSRGQTGEDNIRKKAMSYRTAHDSQKKHIVDRIQVVVKGMIFRKMKFITSEAMFNRAMKIVLETEEPDDEDEFVRIYKTCVVGSIKL
ncbi:hypothetical protein MHU86_12810 [Fragilaria crotonensis]|nr:hypothetical protein MHU86_12810 [Fragilaria crotonensis]